MEKTKQIQHFIELSVNSNGVNYYIKFNDINIYSETSRSPVTNKIPVNHWINNGKNTLLISANLRTKSIDEKLAEAEHLQLNVSVLLRTKIGEQEYINVISQYDLSVNDELLEQLTEQKPELSDEDKLNLIASNSSKPQQFDLEELNITSQSNIVETHQWVRSQVRSWVDLSQDITLNLGFPEWAYLSADDLGNPKNMSDDEYFGLTDNLYEEYKNIWQLMKDKNKNALLPLFELRASEYDAAYYLPHGEKLSDMEYSLRSAFEHDALTIADIVDNERAQLTIAGNGKIAILKVAAVAEPLIYYKHVRDSFTRSYTLYFMRKDGKWIIIR